MCGHFNAMCSFQMLHASPRPAPSPPFSGALLLLVSAKVRLSTPYRPDSPCLGSRRCALYLSTHGAGAFPDLGPLRANLDQSGRPMTWRHQHTRPSCREYFKSPPESRRLVSLFTSGLRPALPPTPPPLTPPARYWPLLLGAPRMRGSWRLIWDSTALGLGSDGSRHPRIGPPNRRY